MSAPAMQGTPWSRAGGSVWGGPINKLVRLTSSPSGRILGIQRVAPCTNQGYARELARRVRRESSLEPCQPRFCRLESSCCHALSPEGSLASLTTPSSPFAAALGIDSPPSVGLRVSQESLLVWRDILLVEQLIQSPHDLPLASFATANDDDSAKPLLETVVEGYQLALANEQTLLSSRSVEASTLPGESAHAGLHSHPRLLMIVAPPASSYEEHQQSVEACVELGDSYRVCAEEGHVTPAVVLQVSWAELVDPGNDLVELKILCLSEHLLQQHGQHEFDSATVLNNFMLKKQCTVSRFLQDVSEAYETFHHIRSDLQTTGNAVVEQQLDEQLDDLYEQQLEQQGRLAQKDQAVLASEPSVLMSFELDGAEAEDEAGTYVDYSSVLVVVRKRHLRRVLPVLYSADRIVKGCIAFDLNTAGGTLYRRRSSKDTFISV
eukprot:scaffold1863_cov381-Prasinococcus_capsulatus_cf.AAC.5